MRTLARVDTVLKLRVSQTHTTADTALGAIANMAVADQFSSDSQSQIAFPTTSRAEICSRLLFFSAPLFHATSVPIRYTALNAHPP